MTIQYMAPGFEPTTFGTMSPPITTRPGLLKYHHNNEKKGSAVNQFAEACQLLFLLDLPTRLEWSVKDLRRFVFDEKEGRQSRRKSLFVYCKNAKVCCHSKLNKKNAE